MKPLSHTVHSFFPINNWGKQYQWEVLPAAGAVGLEIPFHLADI